MNDPEVSQEVNYHTVGIVDQTHTIGQSFISRRGRFNGITFWVTTVPISDSPQFGGQLLVKLFYSPGDNYPLYASSIPISPAWQNSQIEISFPPQDDRPNISYYVQIESTGSAIQIHGRNEDIYSNGTAYADRKPIVADITFRTTYDYNVNSVLEDLYQIGIQIRLILPLGLTLIFPGWILLDLTGLRRRYTTGEQVAISVGLSLAIIPLLMLWTTVLHIQWSRHGVIGVLGFSAGFYVFRFIIRFLKSQAQSFSAYRSQIASCLNLGNPDCFYSIALILIISGAFFVRIAMVRDLATPAWVDSVHHAMITRLIIQNGGIPESYSPYMEFNIHNYHVGFHSGLAVFSWLSGLEIPDAMLIYGQFLNALAALAVYLLTLTFTHKPQAGLFAAFITAFLTPMPAYYTSWGRYTQLAGLLILPSILALLVPAYSQTNNEQFRKLNRFSIVIAIIAISGLFLVHYRVIAFAFMLLISSLITDIPLQRSRLLPLTRHWLSTSIACLLVAMVLVSPWLFPAITDIFLPKLSPPDSTQVELFGDFSWRFLTTAYGKQAIVLACLGSVWALFKNRGFLLIIILWLIQLFFFANLDALKLPGGGFITGTSVAIMLFIPISMLGGYFFDILLTSWNSTLVSVRSHLVRAAFYGTIAIISIIAAAFGARQLLPIVNPTTILSRNADRIAFEWIFENMPVESRFLINPFSWGFGLFAGSDGGYWISPTTGLLSVPPPALYGLGDSESITKINSINQLVLNTETTPQLLYNMMTENHLDHIYIGARGGPLSPSDLMQSGRFEQIYHSSGVWIFKLLSIP